MSNSTYSLNYFLSKLGLDDAMFAKHFEDTNATFDSGRSFKLYTGVGPKNGKSIPLLSLEYYNTPIASTMAEKVKARFQDGAVDKAYRGEVWSAPPPPQFPKPPLHPPAPTTKRNAFTVRPTSGGRRKKRKTRRRQ